MRGFSAETSFQVVRKAVLRGSVCRMRVRRFFPRPAPSTAASVFASAFVFGSKVEARSVLWERSCLETVFPTETGFAFCGKS